MKSKIKVGLFVDTFYPMVDGVIRVVDNYARRLKDKCNVTVYAPRTSAAFPIIDKVLEMGSMTEDDIVDRSLPYKVVRCNCLPFKTNNYVIPAPIFDVDFMLKLNKSKLDIVHIHSPFTVGQMGLYYAKLQKIPVVATLHSQYKQDFERAVEFKPAVDVAMASIMNVFNNCNECWTVNTDIRNLYIEEYGLKSPCLIKNNATDHVPVKDKEAAARMIERRFGLKPDDTVLLFIGRLTFLKGLDLIVNSLKNVKGAGFRFKMLFVGEGADEKALRTLINKNKLADDCVLCGRIDEKADLEAIYSRAKLFLFPSLYDTNSLVQIEAACQGVPTLFRTGARTAAMVKDNHNGFFAGGTPEEYAKKLTEILSNEELYEKVAENARKELYKNWDTVVDEVYSDYLRLLKQ
ncbi:MAG: glycosyltransferase [Bacteroidales bacterium]|nr:glycosyltransferase [Bacteroidales bacterium]